jgi:hypothetical protein
MNTSNTTTHTTFPDSWYDLWKSNQPLDFEAFLDSDLLATRRNQVKTYAIIYHTTGSVSLNASTCLAVHILRSHHGLSTTYHRLVFGLCIGDPVIICPSSWCNNGAKGNELFNTGCTRQHGNLHCSGIPH